RGPRVFRTPPPPRTRWTTEALSRSSAPPPATACACGRGCRTSRTTRSTSGSSACPRSARRSREPTTPGRAAGCWGTPGSTPPPVRYGRKRPPGPSETLFGSLIDFDGSIVAGLVCRSGRSHPQRARPRDDPRVSQDRLPRGALDAHARELPARPGDALREGVPADQPGWPGRPEDPDPGRNDAGRAHVRRLLPGSVPLRRGERQRPDRSQVSHRRPQGVHRREARLRPGRDVLRLAGRLQAEPNLQPAGVRGEEAPVPGEPRLRDRQSHALAREPRQVPGGHGTRPGGRGPGVDSAPRPRLQDAHPRAAARRLSAGRELGAARPAQGPDLQPRGRADGGGRARAVAVLARVRSSAPAARPGRRARPGLLAQLLRQEPPRALRERRRRQPGDSPGRQPRPAPPEASSPSQHLPPRAPPPPRGATPASAVRSYAARPTRYSPPRPRRASR